ncbi:hypothetical protein J4558_23115 [Leptolyngbya sp. 15MV]|nr:hypothetical protein J4558_23115 [Leptolyngbya sp. 15MV]
MGTPARFTSARQASTRAIDRSMGFSQKIALPARAVPRGQRLGRWRMHVHHMRKPRAAAGGEIAGMDGADAAGAELCELDHRILGAACGRCHKTVTQCKPATIVGAGEEGWLLYA